MKQEIETFDAELQMLLQDTGATTKLVDNNGIGLAHQTQLLNRLAATLDENEDARFRVLERLLRPQRVPLSDARREQLASSITGQLPRMFESERARQTPPPMPRQSDQYDRLPSGYSN